MGRFVPNVVGYRDVMNSNNDVMTACEVRAGAIAASASRQSGLDYVVDAQTGINRVHARASTDGSRGAFWRERHYHALAIAVSNAGGQMGATWGNLARAMRKSARAAQKGRQTGWRAPTYRGVGRR